MRANGAVLHAWSWVPAIGVLLGVALGGAQAGTWVTLDSVKAAQAQDAKVEVLARTDSELTVSVDLAGLELTAHDTPAGAFVLVESPATSPGRRGGRAGPARGAAPVRGA